MDTYVERLDLPSATDKDGNTVAQYAEFYTRLGGARYRMVQIAQERDQIITAQLAKNAGVAGAISGVSDGAFADGLTQAFLVRGVFVDYLTGEVVDAAGVGRAAPDIYDAVTIKAAELWTAWRKSLEVPKGTPQDSTGPTDDHSSPSTKSAKASSAE